MTRESSAVQQWHPPAWISVETVLPPVHDQAVVVSDLETVTFEPAPHLSHERHLAITSAIGE